MNRITVMQMKDTLFRKEGNMSMIYLILMALGIYLAAVIFTPLIPVFFILLVIYESMKRFRHD